MLFAVAAEVYHARADCSSTSTETQSYIYFARSLFDGAPLSQIADWYARMTPMWYASIGLAPALDSRRGRTTVIYTIGETVFRARHSSWRPVLRRNLEGQATAWAETASAVRGFRRTERGIGSTDAAHLELFAHQCRSSRGSSQPNLLARGLHRFAGGDCTGSVGGRNPGAAVRRARRQTSSHPQARADNPLMIGILRTIGSR